MNFNNIFEELLLELSGQEIYQKYYSKIPYETFLDIVMADPKTNISGSGELLSIGKYSKLLLSFYQKGSLRDEDLAKAEEYLECVYSHNIALDVSKLKNLGDLYQVVQKYLISDTQDLNEILKALVIDQDYKLLHQGKDWDFYQPLTEKGSSYLGFATEWCTAWGQYCLNKKYRERQNHFERHNGQGPLFIMMSKINPLNKYQFHFETNQFMDPKDSRINFTEFWPNKDEIKNYFFPSLVRETSEEEVKNELQRISILPDADGMVILKKSIGTVNNPLVEAIINEDEDALEDLVDGEERDGSVYVYSGRLIIQVDGIPGDDAEGVERSIDQYRGESNNGWEWVHSDIENRYYDVSDYEDDFEKIFKSYYDNHKIILQQELGINSYEIFKEDYFDNYLGDNHIVDTFVDDITDLSYASYEAENDREADAIEKYLSFGSSDELNFSIVFLVQFLIKRNIVGLGGNYDWTIQDMVSSYISHYKLTTEIDEPVYNYETTYPKYGDNNYITKSTDEHFGKLLDNPETNHQCVELRKQLNYIIKTLFKGSNKFENDHVKIKLKSNKIDCEKGTVNIEFVNKDTGQVFYDNNVKVENLPRYATNYELNLKENKKMKLVITESQLENLKKSVGKGEDIGERSRSFAFTRKKRKFSKPERMSNPLRYKEKDRLEEEGEEHNFNKPLTPEQIKSIEQINKDAKFLTCRNCRHKFTQTTHKKKKSLPICPTCGTHNK
jgi:Zn finger protein HypA/HybF involved in hydrogenase expression